MLPFPMTPAQVREAVFFTLVVLSVAIAWYFAWVKPNDEFMQAVMECMGSDAGRDAYDQCVMRLRR